MFAGDLSEASTQKPPHFSGSLVKADGNISESERSQAAEPEAQRRPSRATRDSGPRRVVSCRCPSLKIRQKDKDRVSHRAQVDVLVRARLGGEKLFLFVCMFVVTTPSTYAFS